MAGFYELLFCSNSNAELFSGGDMCGGGDTQPLQDGKKKFEPCTQRGGGDVKTFQLSLPP